MKSQSINQNLLFCFFILILSFVYRFDKIITLEPQSIHQWRQADCLSIAKNYQTNLSFFEPSIHNYISDNSTSGMSAGEFPVIYYLVGALWQLFGEHIFIYRLLVLLLFYSGLWALFKTCKTLFKSNFWSHFVSLFAFTSPVLIYYSNNFLTNVPALAMIFWAWFFLIRYFQSQKLKLLLFSVLFFSLGALLKMTAALSFIAIIGLYVLEFLGLKLSTKKVLFEKKLKVGLLFLAGLGIIFSWYWWAEHYNSIHGGKYTFNWLWPIWEMSNEEIEKAFASARNFIYYQAFSGLSIYMLWGALLFLIIDYKNNSRFVNLFIPILILGVSSYLILWFNALDGHDYYIINLLFLLLSILIALVMNFKTNRPWLLKSKKLRILAVLFLLFNIVYAANNIRYRYGSQLSRNSTLAKLMMDDHELGLWNYLGNHNPYKPLKEMRNYNRSIGIKESDLIIYKPDPSINISLYLLNQKGWTDYGGTESYEAIHEKVTQKNAKYLIIEDQSTLEKEYLSPFIKNKIGEFKGIKVFDLQKGKE